MDTPPTISLVFVIIIGTPMCTFSTMHGLRIVVGSYTAIHNLQRVLITASFQATRLGALYSKVLLQTCMDTPKC